MKIVKIQHELCWCSTDLRHQIETEGTQRSLLSEAEVGRLSPFRRIVAIPVIRGTIIAVIGLWFDNTQRRSHSRTPYSILFKHTTQVGFAER